MPEIQRLFARYALLPEGWKENVLLQWDHTGQLLSVTTDSEASQAQHQHPGVMLPGMPNLHSHAFQRAFSGLTEYRAQSEDNFWSWRTSMYDFANRIAPSQLEDIATYLYIEMLQAGYTSVCEFHYLHQDIDGKPYANDTELSLALIRAAARAGIGLTLLPVLYQQSGFGDPLPQYAQRRFIRSTDSLLGMIDHLRPQCLVQGGNIGLAPHSLRAVQPQALADAVSSMRLQDPDAPIHIHIAEQQREVTDCLAWSGQRPVQWLLDHYDLDAHWCLVHATHLDMRELASVAKSRAVAGLCLTTEANLGDGIFPAREYLERGGRWGIGSDSHISVSVVEELRLLEYAQRLSLQQRNVLVSPDMPQLAQHLYTSAVSGGACASSRPIAGLHIGQQADFVLLNPQHPLLEEMSVDSQLASHLFAITSAQAIASVWTKGSCRIEAGQHRLGESAARAFSTARKQLLG